MTYDYYPLADEYADPQGGEPVAGSDACQRCYESDDEAPHATTCPEFAAQARAEISEILGFDTDALAAELEDLGL